LELFIENNDWPANNMRCWQLGDGLWRWFFYDGDACLRWMTFSAFDNAVYVGDETWPSSTISTLFFRKLLDNEDFKVRFESRFLELLDTAFDFSVTSPIFENIKTQIETEIPFQSDRFDFPENVEAWELDMNRVNYFLNARKYFILEPLHSLLDGLPENLSNNLWSYPNPFMDEIRIGIEMAGFGIEEVAIYDLTGRKVFVQPCCLHNGHNEIVLRPDVKAGVYLLKLGNLTMKVVKQ